MDRVLLGVCDQTCCAVNTSWSTNKLGGDPDWLSQDVDTDVTCRECKCLLAFVGQLHCPVGLHTNRVLYLFTCLQTSCIKSCKSWTAIRCQADDDDLKSTATSKCGVKLAFDFNLDELDWDADVHDDDSCYRLHVSETLQDNNNHSIKISDLHGKQSDIKTKDGSLQEVMSRMKTTSIEPSFKPLHVDVFDEDDLETDVSLVHEEELLKKYLQQESLSVNDLTENVGDSQGNEAYQKFDVEDMNRCQRNFFRILKKCPEQVIRYCYKGQPLYYDAPVHPSLIPHCPCGSPRVFEFQVMPAVINYLQSNKKHPQMHLEDMDVVTSLVYTCSSNCWTNGGGGGRKEEFVVVMKDDPIRRGDASKKRGKYKLR